MTETHSKVVQSFDSISRGHQLFAEAGALDFVCTKLDLTMDTLDTLVDCSSLLTESFGDLPNLLYIHKL